MADETEAAARAPELAEPMADMLASPLATAAQRLGREPLEGTTDLEFFLGVATAFSGVFAVGLGVREGGSLHMTLIYYIMRRVSGSDHAAERFTRVVTDHMGGQKRPAVFLEGFRVGETAAHQCYYDDDPASGQATLLDGYRWALGGDSDSGR